MKYKVVFSPEAEEHLLSLLSFVAQASFPERAAAFVEDIVSYCESFADFPLRGTVRDDIRQGLRVTNFKKRVVIAFAVTTDTVSILGVFYGGRDYASLLSDTD